MRRLILIITVSIVLLTGTAMRGGVGVHAQSNGQYSDQYSELQDREAKKAELEAKLSQLQGQEHTLANQIAYLENQTYLTQLEQANTRSSIEETQGLLEGVNIDIDSLSDKLGNLDGSINDLYEVLASRIRTSYQLEKAGAGFLLDGENMQSLILQTAYLHSLQEEDKRLLGKMNDTRDVYQIQKDELEQLKTEKEELKAQLESQNQQLEQQKTDLANQQNSKAWLLYVTQSEESKYQQLIAQMEEEIRAIRAALTSLGTVIGEVHQGDVIGHLGNTGCSTGPHVHFGYYVNGVAVNPLSKLNSGAFIWPVLNPNVTQYYGENYAWYMQNFGMPGHNGIDMTDASVGYGAPVLAVADGIAYRVSDSSACWLTGTVGQGVRIDHPDGTKTIYWHLQ
ncbi:peptidoglycan DD-metalloendopeptidase family protein [candidate division WWE3 bacterium]|uniref:Peptidoglycan DD-metalloendopeptidase family protein n=1 Tax=candidate division WWE3 bacterium TaxID=2053526 RepID=A0A955RRJ6_UNCKA|nr:peptidoglycan DD-metalloendopeptidase family protein [candidate division WWE3 bacterium]